MSEETTKLEPDAPPVGDPLDFYKSVTADHREMDREFVLNALDNAIFPTALRYDLFRGGYRGVIKALDGNAYYFNLPPNGAFHLVKAVTDTQKWESERLFKGCGLGCDLVHKSDKDEDEEDKEGKAGPIGGGGTAEMPPASQPEAQNVASQDAQITTEHPGGAMGTTPQSDSSEARWHGTPGLAKALPDIDASAKHNAWTGIELMKAYGQLLQETAPRLEQVDPKLQQFCVEVLGKMPSEVQSGPIKLNGMQRAQYNAWLTKSTRTRVDGLASWLEKRK